MQHYPFLVPADSAIFAFGKRASGFDVMRAVILRPVVVAFNIDRYIKSEITKRRPTANRKKRNMSDSQTAGAIPLDPTLTVGQTRYIITSFALILQAC